MVQAWVGHYVTPIPTLGLLCGTYLSKNTTSDNNQMRPQHTTQTHNKHHHHGGGAANLSSSVDLMNPRHTRAGWAAFHICTMVQAWVAHFVTPLKCCMYD